MPWLEPNLVSIRNDFVLRALEPGANLSALCKRFGISRKTDYKWLKRYREQGVLGLEDMAKGPATRRPLKLSPHDVIDILAVRDAHTTWGARKIRAVLQRRAEPGADVPSVRTIGRVLVRAGRVSHRKNKRRARRPGSKPLVDYKACNEGWTVDFKGWWRTGSGEKCEPLTVRDAHSRFILTIRVLPSIGIEHVRPVFEELFRTYGLPKAIQTDNGSPFASAGSQCGLTKLSAWWIALGIEFIRGRPGKPQDNGAHERMHRDMKAELQKHPSWDLEQQQAACERWRYEFNHIRPHEALGQQTPASVYQRSQRLLPAAPPQPTYPADWETRQISKPGTMRFRGAQRHVSTALGGYTVGIEHTGKDTFAVWFGSYCVGVATLPWDRALRPPPTDEESS